MDKLKQAYSIRKDAVENDSIDTLGKLFQSNSAMDVVNINPDKTIFIGSNGGLDSIRKSVELETNKFINKKLNFPINMLYNLLPLSPKTCIFRF